MSEKTMTASTPSLRKGWMETSTASCGVLQTSRNACFARISRYSGRYRPRLAHHPHGDSRKDLPAAGAKE